MNAERPHPPEPDPGRRGWRSRRSRLAAAFLALCLLVIGAAAALLVRGSGSHAAPAKAVPLGTTTVERGTLVSTARFHGQLRYPSRGSVHLSGAGTVTSLPAVGRVLTDGATVAGVDDQPIGVLFGSTPLYRTLGARSTAAAELAVQSARAELLGAQATLAQTRSSQAGHGTRTVGARGSTATTDGPGSTSARAASTAQAEVGVTEAQDRLLGAEQALRHVQTPQQGPDVALVAGNMTALGYGRGFTDSWDPALAQAVRGWQLHIGAAPTGAIAPGAAIVIRGAARVTGVQGQVGDAASAVTLTLSSSTRVATFSLRNGAPAALAVGRRVRLSAQSRSTTGRVTAVTTGQRSSSVQVSLPRSSAVARMGSDRVTMSVTTSRPRDVLLVSTQALLALASGGYALQLPDGRLLAVRTGAVENGDIAVSGVGVHVGLRVVSVT